jgi:16S rRNA (cytosine1402-N4)-methyltransferase
MSAPHVPVLADLVVEHLVRPEARWFLDGTLGAGGHARLVLEALPEARLLGLDRDPSALELARERLGPLAERATLVHAPFDEAPRVAAELGLGPFDGILLDVGVSSMQLDQPERGFSFQADGPLDMRMDPTRGESAADLIARLREDELADVIYELGEERGSRRIARAIVEERARGPIVTTGHLADVVRRAAPRGRPPRGPRRRKPIDRATRTFQALRLAVNDELGQLDRALPALFELLAPGGRLAVISFHSLEDRRVKHYFRSEKQAKRGRVLTKKPLQADPSEVFGNPRARSAKLRVIERIDSAG